MNKKCLRCFGTGEEPNHVKIGKEMNGVRLGLKIGLRVLSRRMGISASYLWRLEHGENRWSQDLIERYFKHTNQSLAQSAKQN